MDSRTCRRQARLACSTSFSTSVFLASLFARDWSIGRRLSLRRRSRSQHLVLCRRFCRRLCHRLFLRRFLCCRLCCRRCVLMHLLPSLLRSLRRSGGRGRHVLMPLLLRLRRVLMPLLRRRLHRLCRAAGCVLMSTGGRGAALVALGGRSARVWVLTPGAALPWLGESAA